MSVEQFRGSHCVNRLLAGCKDYPLRKTLVDYDLDTIIPVGHGEIGDVVDQYVLKRAGNIVCGYGLWWRCRRVSVGFVLLT